jgi:NADPH-dependent curcumin reductase CurA
MSIKQGIVTTETQDAASTTSQRPIFQRPSPGHVQTASMLFFDNVGGPTLEAAIANLRVGARVVICGRISQTAGGGLYGVRNLGQLIGKRARIHGFGVFEFADRYPEARAWLAAQARSGRLRQHVHVIDWLKRAPIGLGMLFRGENQGKLVVRVAE